MMYLKEIEHAEPPPEAGRFGRAIKSLKAQGKEPPGIYYLFSQRPAAAKHLCDYMQEVMRGPSPLPPGQRELIAALTSARNDCLF